MWACFIGKNRPLTEGLVLKGVDFKLPRFPHPTMICQVCLVSRHKRAVNTAQPWVLSLHVEDAYTL